MINVIVSYRVNPEFVEENASNIQRFFEDFRKLNTKDFRYEVFTKDDGVTFVHSSSYRDEKVQDEVLNVPSFKEFQRLRDESGLDGTHQVEILDFVNSATEILG
jgi:quinol monooxygenase YgiN